MPIKEINMKSKLFTLSVILILIITALTTSVALAGAYETSYITSITYQNVDLTATTNLRFYFYDSPSDTTPIEIVCDGTYCNNLNPGAGASLFIGNIGSVGPGFRGTAVMASDKKMVATLVQLPQGSTTVKNRPLSNGFSGGTTNSLLATVVKNSFSQQQYTVLSVQNAGTSSTPVAIKFYNTSATLVHTINDTLQPGAGRVVDTGAVTQLGTVFNGSVVIESTGGSIVSSAMEMDSNGYGNKAYEGVGAGALKFYMPSALCNFGSLIQNTNYAVQNTHLSQTTNVTVTYSNGASETKSIGPGAKASFNTCQASGMVNNFIGSAVVQSDNTNIIAVGKAAGGGISTAFVGFVSGSEDIALPYVRWGNDTDFNNGSEQRTYIAIQNVGASTVTGNILVKYINRNGVVEATHTITDDILSEGKVNSNASLAGLTEFGYYGPGQIGGGVIIEGPPGSQLVAIGRVSTTVTALSQRAGEDFSGVPLAP